MMKHKYYEEIDALKGIAIFLVILAHAIIVYPINLHENNACLTLFDFVSTVHMPLFFVISGYNYHFDGNYKNYITKKAKRLLMPYFVFNLLEILPRVLLSGFINKQIDIKSFVINMFINGGNYWFVYTLFVMYLVFPLITKLVSSNCYILIAVGIILNVINPGRTFLTANLVFRYLIYFIIGFVLSLKMDLFQYKINNKFKLFLLITICAYSWATIFTYRDYFNYIAYSFIVSILGIVTLYLLTNIGTVVNLFKGIGKYSLPLFLMNGFVLVVSRTIVCSFTSNLFIIVVFNLAFDLFIPYLLIKYVLVKNTVLKAIIGQ